MPGVESGLSDAETERVNLAMLRAAAVPRALGDLGEAALDAPGEGG